MDCQSYRLDGVAQERAANDPREPWRGHFACAQRERVREALGRGRDAVLVMSGLESLANENDTSRLADMERLARIPSVHFVLHGSLWGLRSAAFRRFAQRYGSRTIYAGSSRRLYEDIRLVAAADLMLDDISSAHNDARYLRSIALGGTFDTDIRNLLLDSADLLSDIGDGGMHVVRNELDRIADECLNADKEAQTRKKWQGKKDSNLRMPESKSGALGQLGDSPT